jgi:hypothetical protein
MSHSSEEVTLDDLDLLEALARRATPGPWGAHDFGYYGEQEPSSIVVYEGSRFDWEQARDGHILFQTPRWDSQESDNADFICAANPQVVLALIAEIRRIRNEQDGDPSG